jgi:hypothetical protein
VERVVAVEIQIVHQGQRSRRASTSPIAMARLRATTLVGATQASGRIGDDLRPVGLLDARGIRMHGIDGRLELVRIGLVAAKAPTDNRLRLLDQIPIPLCAVLLAEQHEGAIGPCARRATGFGEEQQGQQPVYVWFVRHERRQGPCQPDRL